DIGNHAIHGHSALNHKMIQDKIEIRIYRNHIIIQIGTKMDDFNQLQPYQAFAQRPFPRPRGIIERLMDISGINRVFLRAGKRPEVNPHETRLLAPAESKLVEIQNLTPSNSIKGKSRLGEHEYYTYQEIVHSQEMQHKFDGGICFNFYLSPLNLHYLLHPTTGKVLLWDYHPHFCYPILFMKSGEVTNERLVLYMETPQGTPYVIILIGSFMVSGIECVAQPGETCTVGSLLGGFRLGSTVMLLFPKNSVTPLVTANT